MTISLQDTFDRVATHLLTQNAKATNDDNDCVYYDPATGHTCAIGCLISPEFYDDSIEGRAATHISVLEALDIRGASTQELRDLLNALQSIHDSTSVEHWPVRLAELASNSELTLPALLRERLDHVSLYD
jgi:hypothetical protein